MSMVLHAYKSSTQTKPGGLEFKDILLILWDPVRERGWGLGERGGQIGWEGFKLDSKSWSRSFIGSSLSE